MYVVEIVILCQLDNISGMPGRVDVAEGTGYAACRYRVCDHVLARCTRGLSCEAVYLLLPLSSRAEESSWCMRK
jgi:hypothetical protein